MHKAPSGAFLLSATGAALHRSLSPPNLPNRRGRTGTWLSLLIGLARLLDAAGLFFFDSKMVGYLGNCVPGSFYVHKQSSKRY